MKNSKDVIVYGSRMLAEMLFYDSIKHTDFNIVAFVQDNNYLNETGKYLGLPQVAFEDVENIYPPSDYDMIVLTASYQDMRNREELYKKAKAKQYCLRNYISPSAIVSNNIIMGDNNVIFEQAYLGMNGCLGSCNTIRQKVYIGHDFTIGDRNVITPGANIGGSSILKNNCYIGIGATILNGITIEDETLIGGGSVVIKSPQPFSKNVGNPSKCIGTHEKEGLKVLL